MRIGNRAFPRDSRIGFFESGLEYRAALVIGGVVLGAQGAFGRSTAVFGTFVRVVVFPTFDASRSVMTVIFRVSIFLTIVALRRASFFDVWFFDTNFCIEKRRDGKNVVVIVLRFNLYKEKRKGAFIFVFGVVNVFNIVT